MSETASSAGRGTGLFNAEELTTEVELDGVLLRLNTDQRDIRYIIKLLNSTEYPYQVIAQACLKIFVDNWEDIADGQRAMDMLYDFIDVGERRIDNNPAPKEIDWEIDFPAIISDMNRVAKCEDIRALPYMHWFTFIAIYNSIGEGNLSYRVGIRRKLRNREKLTKDEREWVARNPDKAYLRQSAVSDEERERLKQRFG